MARDNAREMNLLDQYWDADATNRRYMSHELDESLRHALDRFESADDAPDPEPAFIDQLAQDLTGEPLAQAATTTAPSWNTDTDERTEPQFVAGYQASDLTTRQQSVWRRRARQIGELVAGILVLALVTGGLILAYQNLIGQGEEGIPGAEDEPAGMIPSLKSVEPISRAGDILDGAFVNGTEIGRFDGQDYAFMFTATADPGRNPVLTVVPRDRNGQHEQVGALELDVPWAIVPAPPRVGAMEMALIEDVLYLPIPTQDRRGVWAVDVSDPSNPDEVSILDLDEGLPTRIAGSDHGLLAVPTWQGPLYFVDVSDPSQPEISA